MFKRNYKDIVKTFMNYFLIIATFLTTIAITLRSSENIKFKNILVILFCITTFLSAAYLILTSLKTGYILPMDDSSEVNKKCNKFCTKCKLFVPERAHHCRICNRCIKRMNHHCPWVGRCVNNDNLAYFIRFLFFSTLSYAISTIIYFFYILEYFKKYSLNDNFIFLLPIFLHFLVTLIISFIAFTILLFNILLLLRNITLIEKKIIHDIESIGVISKKNPYDFGTFRNLITLLGKPYFLFLYGENVGSGCTFEKIFQHEYEIWSSEEITRWQDNGADV